MAYVTTDTDRNDNSEGLILSSFIHALLILLTLEKIVSNLNVQLKKMKRNTLCSDPTIYVV